MSISVSRVSHVTVTETYSSGYASSGDNTITVNGLNESSTHTSSTTITVTEYAIGQKAMSGGAGSLDLTAIPDAVTGRVVDGTGQKVQFCKLRNLAANANDIVVTFGASNPYLLLGSAFKITLKPGQSIEYNLNGAGGVIGSGAKSVDISGTLAQVLEYEFIFS